MTRAAISEGRRRGFTLVELLVAVVILAVGLTGVAGLSIHALNDLSDAAARSSAVRTALQIADSLTATGSPSSGERNLPGGMLRWSASGETASGATWIRFEHRSGGPDGESPARPWRSVGYVRVAGR